MQVPLQIHSGIHGIDISFVQLFPQLLHAFPKALEVNDFAFSQEFDHIVDIGIVGKT
jgi:hypothetical protein